MIDIAYGGYIHEEMHSSVHNGSISKLLHEFIDESMNFYIRNNLYTEPKSEYDTLIFKKITLSKLIGIFKPVNGIKTTRFQFVTDLLNTIERIMIWLEKPMNFDSEKRNFIQIDRNNKIDEIIKN